MQHITNAQRPLKSFPLPPTAVSRSNPPFDSEEAARGTASALLSSLGAGDTAAEIKPCANVWAWCRWHTAVIRECACVRVRAGKCPSLGFPTNSL